MTKKNEQIDYLDLSDGGGAVMLKWLRHALGLCEHKWQIVREAEVREGPDSRLSCKIVGTLQCQICGNVKRRRLL